MQILILWVCGEVPVPACSAKLLGDAHVLDHDLSNESLVFFTKKEIKLVSATK